MLKSIQKGFTLIELIIVITILVLLGVVVIVLIDPAEILAQFRDSQCISDLASMKGATQLVLAGGVPSASLRSYCGTGFPATSTSSYLGSSTSTAQQVDGTGWIRINYTATSTPTGRALTSLPIDPKNTESDGLYYRWGCVYGSDNIYSYEVDAKLESAKYTTEDNKASRDGGNNAGRYEIGNRLDVIQ